MHRRSTENRGPPASPGVPGWSSRLVFILATVGFSVGLGNIWKFPYVAGQNGGGAFVLVYLACAFAIGAPLVMAELLIGRRGGGTPVTAMRAFIARHGSHPAWAGLGWLALATVFVIISFYSVIGGWTVDYALLSLTGRLDGIDARGAAGLFDSVLANPLRMGIFHTLFLAAALWIVGRGLAEGIERAVRSLMPALFALLLVLVGYALVVGDAKTGLAFLFEPDFSRIDGKVVLAAAGQAFFSIGIGMAAMLTYGSYLPAHVDIPRSAGIVVLADTLVAILAGVAIFPLVFGFGLSPDEGPGLIFQTLPVAFGGMPFGVLFGTLFFALLIIAALTSAIAAIEPAVAFSVERGRSRRRAVLTYGAGLWLAGWLTVLSFNVLAGFHPLAASERFAKATVFDIADFVSSNLMLTTGGLLVALFTGWVLPAADAAGELGLPPRGSGFRTWRFLVRWVCPSAIVLMIVFGLRG